MAYRFLLEVPGALAAEASVAVEQTGDAQVILVRDSHGLGFEDPYVDLTVAAHTLRVIDGLYDWFDSLGASRPDFRVVLHGGERLNLEASDRGAMVAAIRRDQPWVERSIPKVGDHEPPEAGTAAPGASGLAGVETGGAAVAIDAAGGNAPVAATVAGRERSSLAPEADGLAELSRRVEFRVLNHVTVQINDVPKAERFYAEFLNFRLVGRARRGRDGDLLALDGDYRWDEAMRAGIPADVSFVANGPVRLALLRAGRGARLERGVIEAISVAVDSRSYATLRGEVLLRPLTLLGQTETSFRFRDPFNVVWEIVIDATVPSPRA